MPLVRKSSLVIAHTNLQKIQMNNAGLLHFVVIPDLFIHHFHLVWLVHHPASHLDFFRISSNIFKCDIWETAIAMPDTNRGIQNEKCTKVVLGNSSIWTARGIQHNHYTGKISIQILSRAVT